MPKNTRFFAYHQKYSLYLSKDTDMALKNKEYLYNFVGGGWNSEYAKTKRGAISQAKKRWKDSPDLVIDEKSFRVSTPEDYNNCLSLFY